MQAKSLPFQIEDMLQRTDMVQLNLTDEEITDLLEKFLQNPSSNDSNDKSLRLVDEIVRLKPPLNAEGADKLQTWSDKYQEEPSPISKLLAVKLLNVLINTKRVSIGLTEYEAANWYSNWTHPQLADIDTRLYKKNSDRFKTIYEI